MCEKEKIATIPYQVLQSGLLSGKYHRGNIPVNSRAAEKPDWLKLDEATFAQLERFETEAKAQNQNLMQYALAWALEQLSVVSLVLGVKSIGQLETLCKVIG